MVKPGTNTIRIRKMHAKINAENRNKFISSGSDIIKRKMKNLEDRLNEIKQNYRKDKNILGRKIIVEKNPETIKNNTQEDRIIVVPSENIQHNQIEYNKNYRPLTTEEINNNFKGIELPNISYSVKEELEDVSESSRRNIDIKYPLVPKNPKKDEHVMAYAHIHWDDKIGNLIYEVIEPKITDEDKKKIFIIKEYIEDKINIIFDEINKKEAIDYLNKKISEAFRYFKITDNLKKEVLRYYIFRDFLGFGKLNAIFNDSQIEDISCDGVNIPVFVYHKDSRIGSIPTNVKFEDKNELNDFVMKLAEKCRKPISILKPLLDGSLPDGSRVQGTLESDIAHKGSNFTIRKFPDMPLTPTDMLLNGTFDINIATYLWMAIENSSSVLISGGTATGKTSMLNAISLFIPKESKIVSIEDTAEIRLFHPNWIPEVSRGSTEGSVTMFDLLKESLRQRPDYIIVGEVRGKEAYVLFQQMATGHPGISTIHAENFDKLLDRLTTQPINLPPNLIENLDIVIFLKEVKYKHRYIRRVNEILEVLGYDRKSNQPIIRTLFKWDPKKDNFIIKDKSYILKKIMDLRGISEDDIKNEFKNRSKLLKWIALRKINDYRLFTRIIDLYNTNKEEVLMRIEAEI